RDKFVRRRNRPLCAETAANTPRAEAVNLDAVIADNDLLGGQAFFEQVLPLDLGGRDNLIGIPHVRTTKYAVPHALQAKTAINRTIHSHWFDHIGNVAPAAEVAYCGAEQIV